MPPKMLVDSLTINSQLISEAGPGLDSRSTDAQIFLQDVMNLYSSCLCKVTCPSCHLRMRNDGKMPRDGHSHIHGWWLW